jgi:hypothetical protein
MCGAGARRFLQHEFKLYLDAVVANAPPQRREGTAGAVNALNAVRTFLNAIYQRNASDNTPNTPWPNFQTVRLSHQPTSRSLLCLNAIVLCCVVLRCRISAIGIRFGLSSTSCIARARSKSCWSWSRYAHFP